MGILSEPKKKDKHFEWDGGNNKQEYVHSKHPNFIFIGPKNNHETLQNLPHSPLGIKLKL